jgi:hypothetical protein
MKAAKVLMIMEQSRIAEKKKINKKNEKSISELSKD